MKEKCPWLFWAVGSKYLLVPTYASCNTFLRLKNQIIIMFKTLHLLSPALSTEYCSSFAFWNCALFQVCIALPVTIRFAAYLWFPFLFAECAIVMVTCPALHADLRGRWAVAQVVLTQLSILLSLQIFGPCLLCVPALCTEAHAINCSHSLRLTRLEVVLGHWSEFWNVTKSLWCKQLSGFMSAWKSGSERRTPC